MSTRANIIVQTAPQEFKVIYTHSDGYPHHQGVYLERFHKSYDAAKEIVSLGACSFLDLRVSPEPGEAHAFDRKDRAPFCSVFYARDRAEGVMLDTTDTLEKALKLADNEYVYVWLEDAGSWLWSEVKLEESDGDYVVVTEVLDLMALDNFIATDDRCLGEIARLDETGMTLEWRDAGCPHYSVESAYGPDRYPVPLYDDGEVRAFDDETLNPVVVCGEGVPCGVEEAPKKKRKVATKAEKTGFAYQEGAWA
jgi:hypothetical protein